MERTYSPLTRDAARLLGKRIRVARKKRNWTLDELAERIGVTRPTAGKVEKGDLSVGIGTYFEAAVLTEVPLFSPDPALRRMVERESDLELALLPDRVRTVTGDSDPF